MSRPVLPPQDARLLDLLVQVCHIARRRNLGTHADVLRVANAHLHPRYIADPKPVVKPTPRKKRPPKPVRYDIPDEPAEVELTPRLAAVLEDMVAGNGPDDIAAHLHVARGTAANAMTLVARAIGAVDRVHAVRLVQAGAVHIQVKDTRRKAA